MPFRTSTLYLIPAALLSLEATWQGCSLGCFVLSPARCRIIFTMASIALGEVLPVWHNRSMEEKERAAFAAMAVRQA
jgi:hypothetical protein